MKPDTNRLKNVKKLLGDFVAGMAARLPKKGGLQSAPQAQPRADSSVVSLAPSRVHPGLTYIAPVLRVPNLERSLAFYRDRLGFEVEFNYEDFYASVLRDGCRIHLRCAPAAQRDQAAFEHAEHLDACIMVSGAEALSSTYAARGVTFSVALRKMPYGAEFYVRDPDGYILGFVEPATE